MSPTQPPTATEEIKEQLALVPKRNYQFASTLNAWRSKYSRHTGKKQIRRQFRSEFRAMDDAAFTEFNNRSAETKAKFPDWLAEILDEELAAELIRRRDLT